MEKNINIEDYKDYENISIAEYVAAMRNIENKALESAKKKDFKTAMHYSKIYFELNKLHSKKIRTGSELGYKPRGRS